MWSLFSRDPTKDFPFEIGEAIQYHSDRLIWKLHRGKKKGLDEEVTIFVVDSKTASPSEIETAKACVKRLRTLRHPSVLTYLGSVESDKTVLLATEFVEPLEKHLEKKENLAKDLAVSWGLFQVTRALSFLINDGNMRHNNVHMGSIFVNLAGEWKLGGVEFITAVDASPVLGKIPGRLHDVDPPEVKSGGKLASKWSTDSWGLGILIWETFNGQLSSVSSLNSSTNKIPKSIVNVFKELVNPVGASRPNPADVIVKCRSPGGFYRNDLADCLLFLEEIQIKDQNDKNRFFNGISGVLDKFPEDICRHKILPQLVYAFEFGNAGSAVLAPLFKLGKLLSEQEYQSKIVPCVVKLFASTDRATRVRLLQQLENFAPHLQPATVNDQIFPNIILGFMDTNPTVREQTVKAMLHIAPKLNNNNLNVELLKHFAKLQVKDDQGGIRTNTTICLGKIACYLHPQTRRKVLIPAFTRVFQDTFPQAKIAGILALAATQQYYLLSEVATKILPALSCLACDPDKTVRDHVFKTIKGFLSKLEKASEDPAAREKFESEVDTSTPTVGDAASTWAGWAVGALTSKFNRSQSQQSVTAPGSRPKGHYPFNPQVSSSTSTTTSSIPSTPSIERDVLQPTAEGQESATDYDDNDWENEEWGSIDGNDHGVDSPARTESREVDRNSRGLAGLSVSSPASNVKTADGWDTWAADEDDGWKDSEADIQIEKDDWSSNASNKSNPDSNDFFSASVSNGKPQNATNDFKPSEPDWGSADTDRSDEMRKRREERKLERQQEMETKKATRSGPMKLGAKKI